MRTTILLAALSVATLCGAQRQTFYASDFPELIPANAGKQIKELYPTVELAKARYPDLYRWWTGIEQQSEATFMTMDLFPACWNEAEWSGNGTGFTPGVQCNSRNNIDFSKVYGQYLVNVACRVFQGRYVGANTSIGGAPPNYTANASTELIYDQSRWQDPAPIRAIILSTNWGTETYLESVYIADFRIEGRAPNWLTAQEQHGIALRTMGENAQIWRVYVSKCNGNGIWINGSGPGLIFDATCFDNNSAGILYTNDKSGAMGGNSLGMLQVYHGSFDNNSEAIEVRGGGAMDIQYIKSENGLSASRGIPPKNQVVLDVEGWCDVTVSHVTDALKNGPAGPAFVFKSTANVSKVHITQYSQIANKTLSEGRSALIVDPRAKKMWRPADPNGAKYTPMEIVWRGNADQSAVWCDENERWGTSPAALVAYPFGGTGKLGVSPTFEGYNYTAGTPVWSPYGPTTPPVTTPCTYTYSPWSACVGGKQTRTVTGSTPTPCAGTPVLEQACSTPPTTGAKLSRKDVTVSGNTCEALATPVLTTRAKINVTLSALPTGYAIILSDGTTKLQTKEGQPGKVFWGNTHVGTLRVGVNTLDIALPNVNVTCLYQQTCGNSGALVGGYQLLELY